MKKNQSARILMAMFSAVFFGMLLVMQGCSNPSGSSGGDSGTATASSTVKYTLNVDFSGMAPDQGEKFVFRVIDKSLLTVVYQTTVEAIPGPTFSISAGAALNHGHDFQIDFYADHTGNGKYDPPPGDRAWRLTLAQVEGNQNLTFEYNTSFTDVNFP